MSSTKLCQSIKSGIKNFLKKNNIKTLHFYKIGESSFPQICRTCMIPVDTGRKLNVHKTFRRRPGRLVNVLCTFNLRPVSAGMFSFLISNCTKNKYRCKCFLVKFAEHLTAAFSRLNTAASEYVN